jgi:hypothetical protein
MAVNEGVLDRTARLVVGIQMVALGISGAVAGTPGIALVVVGGVLMATGLSGRCLLYKWLGFSTMGKERRTGSEDRRAGYAAASKGE